jgi:hypothetical protein
MRRLRWVPILLVPVVLASCHHNEPGSTLATGQPGSSNIIGIVTDYDGVPIPSAEVTLNGPALSGVRMTTTDLHGYYSIRAVPSGANYRLRAATKCCYASFERKGMELLPWSTIKINFKLEMGFPQYITPPLPQIDYTKTAAPSIYVNDPVSGEMRPR